MDDFLKYWLNPLVAILTFTLGFFLNFISSNRKENKRRKKLLKYFKSYLTEQLNSSKKLGDEVNRFGENLSKKRNGNIGGPDLTFQPFILYDNLDKVELFNSLNKDYKKKEANIHAVLKSIEFLKSVEFELKRLYGDLKSQIQTIRDEWNHSILSLKKTNVANVNKLGREGYTRDEGAMFLNSKLSDWAYGNPGDYFITKEHLLSPLRLYFQEKYNENPKDGLEITVLEQVDQIEIVINQFELTIHEYSNMFLVYSRKINDQLKKIEDSLNEE